MVITNFSDDMFSPAAINDPYTYYGRLREEDPVHWNELYELWVVTRHDDLVWLTRNHEKFSSATFLNDPRPAYPAIYESDEEIYRMACEYQGMMFIQHDRPAHLDMRKVVHRFFTPKSMEEWRPLVISATHHLLDAAEQKDSADLMRDLAVPLPLLVIAEMMGVPESDRPHIRALAEKLLYNNRGEPDRYRTLMEGVNGMFDYCGPLLDERKENPGDDFISVLAGGEKEGVFTRAHTLSNTALLLIAGHETTINLICNGTKAFMENRDQWDLFRQDAEGLMVRAAEEALRYDSPVKTLPRLASEDVELRGRQIKKNDRVRWVIPSANRDPDKFDRPDEMDITRWPNPHVAFGAGVHHCLGATIARVEGQEVFRALAERYPRLEMVPHQSEYQPTMALRSMKQLPVRLNAN